MKRSDLDRRAGSGRRRRATPRADVPLSVEEIRERTRRVLAECEQASPRDPDISAVVAALISETRRLTEAVLVLMPGDSAVLTDRLTRAHEMLARLVAAVDGAGPAENAQSRGRSAHGDEGDSPDRH